MSASGATRLGVDVGGTFTDLIFYDDASGEMRVGKVPTTPAAPEEGVLDASTSELLAGDELALVRATSCTGRPSGSTRCSTRDGRGRRAALRRAASATCSRPAAATATSPTTSSGGRPRRSSHAACGSRSPSACAPTAPCTPARGGRRATRRRRSSADEGVDRRRDRLHQRVREPRARAGGRACAARGRLRRVRSRSPTSSPASTASTSGRRTTVIDAYVRGRMSHYLARLEDGLAAARFRATAARHPLRRRRHDVRGGGAAAVRDRACRGPSRAPRAAPSSPACSGSASVITADVGGTSFDTCLILDGRLPLLFEGKIVGLPLQTSWVDVRSIGAGGGSIAYVDVGGLLRVGPQSAGADPGPASYGRGGTEPTVTDAAAVLGHAGRGPPCRRSPPRRGGRAGARFAPLAESLGLDVEEVARGARSRSSTPNMANAIREITVEQGQDPREATLMAFGGAGPLFGTLLARELEMPRGRRPSVRGQLLGVGPARRRPRPDGVADADHAASTRRARRRNRHPRRAFRARSTARTDAGGGEREVALRHALRRPGALPSPCALPSDRRPPSPPTPARSARLFTRDYEPTFGQHDGGGRGDRLAAGDATHAASAPRRGSASP